MSLQNKKDEEWVKLKIIAMILGISEATIWSYIKRGLLRLNRKSRKGYYLLPKEETLNRIELIKKLLSLGYTLDEISKMFKENKRDWNLFIKKVKKILEPVKQLKNLADVLIGPDIKKTWLSVEDGPVVLNSAIFKHEGKLYPVDLSLSDKNEVPKSQESLSQEELMKILPMRYLVLEDVSTARKPKQGDHLEKENKSNIEDVSEGNSNPVKSMKSSSLANTKDTDIKLYRLNPVYLEFIPQYALVHEGDILISMLGSMDDLPEKILIAGQEHDGMILDNTVAKVVFHTLKQIKPETFCMYLRFSEIAHEQLNLFSLGRISQDILPERIEKLFFPIFTESEDNIFQDLYTIYTNDILYLLNKIESKINNILNHRNADEIEKSEVKEDSTTMPSTATKTTKDSEQLVMVEHK